MVKPIGFASRFFSDTEKKYANIELKQLVVVWGLEHFRFHIYGKPIKLLTDHQALESFSKRNRSDVQRTANEMAGRISTLLNKRKPYSW